MRLLEYVHIPGRTQWSIVYNQATGKVLVCMDMNYQKIYDSYLEMLD